MATLTNLYHDRCILKGDSYIPHFWKPQPMVATPHTLWADDTMPIDAGVVIGKTIALGLCLELPVGEFVNQATKRELPANPILLKLLKSNIADEAAHYRGFQLAAEVYPLARDFEGEAQALADRFQSLPNHPIEVACGLETGLFLITLGLLRLVGGASLADMAAQISRDEYRHAATNRALVKALNFPVVPSFVELIKETIEWLIDRWELPADRVGFPVDRDYLLGVSHELLSTGKSRSFNDLVFFSTHSLPFEIANDRLYSRITHE